MFIIGGIGLIHFEVSSGIVTLADGLTLSVIGVCIVRFRMWDDIIRTVTDLRYVSGMRYKFAVGPWSYFVVTWLSFWVLGAMVSMRWLVWWSLRPPSYQLTLLLKEL
jgi:hypothetical protein